MLWLCDPRTILEVFYRTYILVWHISWWPWEAEDIGDYIVTHRGWGVDKLYVEFTASCSSCTWMILLGISALGDHTYSRSDHAWYIRIGWSLPTWLSWLWLVNPHWGGHNWSCLVNPHWGTILYMDRAWLIRVGRSLWPCMLRSDHAWYIRVGWSLPMILNYAYGSAWYIRVGGSYAF